MKTELVINRNKSIDFYVSIDSSLIDDKLKYVDVIYLN